MNSNNKKPDEEREKEGECQSDGDKNGRRQMNERSELGREDRDNYSVVRGKNTEGGNRISSRDDHLSTNDDEQQGRGGKGWRRK